MKPLAFATILLLMGGCTSLQEGIRASKNPLLSDSLMNELTESLTTDECTALCADRPESCEDFVMALEQVERVVKGCKYEALQSFIQAQGVETTVTYGE